MKVIVVVDAHWPVCPPQVVAAAVRERHEVDLSGAIIVLKVGPAVAARHALHMQCVTQWTG